MRGHIGVSSGYGALLEIAELSFVSRCVKPFPLRGKEDIDWLTKACKTDLSALPA